MVVFKKLFLKRLTIVKTVLKIDVTIDTGVEEKNRCLYMSLDAPNAAMFLN